MSDSDDPESTIPWPGFVDILSTVIIVFVFFMMMTSVIIFLLSEQTKKKAVTEAIKQAQENSSSAQEISKLQQEKQELEKELQELAQLKKVVTESTTQSFHRDKNEGTLTFGDMGVTLTQDSIAAVKQQLPLRGHVVIEAWIPDGKDYNSFREIALNRALNIRNILLQNKTTSDYVSIRISVAKAGGETDPANQYGSVSMHFGQ